jgi:hypothetical protein
MNVIECLDQCESVLMEGGLYKIINTIEIGDKVVTIDPITMEHSISKVINCLTMHTNKKIYDITTVMGHSIRATYDHMFMTDEGWMRVTDFSEDTYLAQSRISNMYDKESEEFKMNVIDLPNNNCFFVQVLTCILIPTNYWIYGIYMDTVMVSNITVESDNNSFIAGNGHFMVHDLS